MDAEIEDVPAIDAPEEEGEEIDLDELIRELAIGSPLGP
jgi:hypothetical protein